MLVHGDERRPLSEMPAARITDNVGEESPGARDVAVLVVDLTIDVASVGRRDHVRRLFLHAVVPGLDADAMSGFLCRKPRDAVRRNLHEIPVVPRCPPRKRQRLIDRGFQQHQLRLDSPYAGSVHQAVDYFAQQQQLVSRALPARADVEVADESFALIADLVGIPDQVGAAPQGEAGKRLHLYETAHEVGGQSEVPRQLALPDPDLFFQQAIQFSYRDLAEVADLN